MIMQNWREETLTRFTGHKQIVFTIFTIILIFATNFVFINIVISLSTKYFAQSQEKSVKIRKTVFKNQEPLFIHQQIEYFNEGIKPLGITLQLSQVNF